jgi:hypothetical protein
MLQQSLLLNALGLRITLLAIAALPRGGVFETIADVSGRAFAVSLLHARPG